MIFVDLQACNTESKVVNEFVRSIGKGMIRSREVCQDTINFETLDQCLKDEVVVVNCP
jgi:hypothetical protein